MSNSVQLNAFPNDKISALAMLYLQNQDLSKLSPEEILDKYDEAHNKIWEYFKVKRNQKRMSFD